LPAPDGPARLSGSGRPEPEALPGQARNLLLIALHPAMPKLALVHQEPFQLDDRLG